METSHFSCYGRSTFLVLYWIVVGILPKEKLNKHTLMQTAELSLNLVSVDRAELNLNDACQIQIPYNGLCILNKSC